MKLLQITLGCVNALSYRRLAIVQTINRCRCYWQTPSFLSRIKTQSTQWRQI
jgi:hypothetical protein